MVVPDTSRSPSTVNAPVNWPEPVKIGLLIGALVPTFNTREDIVDSLLDAKSPNSFKVSNAGPAPSNNKFI